MTRKSMGEKVWGSRGEKYGKLSMEKKYVEKSMGKSMGKSV